MTPIIETEKLTRTFGQTEAVRELSLQIQPGSVYAFLGPNGAGKTTTIKLLLNLLRPSSGKARILGVDSSRLGPKELAQIGYVSENQQIPEWMTVAQMLHYCRPMYPTWDDAFCKKLLKDFNLPEDRKLKNLSRGMKVKACLVSSLAYRPKLLVLDEPFSGLDPLVRDEFIRGILELSEQDGWTIFISSHDIDEVERLADWVGVIQNGHLKLSETTEALQARFRRMEFTVASETTALPSSLPPSWLIPEIAGTNASLVESYYQESVTEAAITSHFPAATLITPQAMTLREIFLALAKVSSPTPPSLP